MATDPPPLDGRPLGRIATALSRIAGGAQLACLLLWPSISQDGVSDEWVFDLAYLVAIWVSLAGWAGLIFWSSASRRSAPSDTVRRLPEVALGLGMLGLGLLLGLLVLVVALSVGRDAAWLTVLAQGVASVVLVALAYALRKKSALPAA